MNDFYDIIIAAICSFITGLAVHSVWGHWRRDVTEREIKKRDT